ncbi:D-glycero-beta-D-manno-heptose 1-phosphate adenylyltransferase [Streptomyces sp. CA-278952]|uniref:D-glycero-beta-D-manno-heptose 1-phosphate adenylyltransferase n=1 Tax=unclassified Streptomyces TaxID=2593676 RepID=UPI002241DD0D|nr:MULTISPECIES: D-glycero-beta-D-manno-heptose 1-phosphate adenylyltransferase [unclassified Streptomyces]UZI27114.1 D-glycero-beta-D-manno-heptose 1-phosphate adenylyltransferase [Streptomyces sp. VB1]WDG27303.1 D-glycero-beta-D-manno-heptose 1-phosphate adenylyltransferase [Streptomyces sp. CA-278952]
MTAPAPLLVVGDALLDHDLSGTADRLAPDAPVPVVHGARRGTRPGGAALAACFAAADGRDVTLVTALGDGEAARTLRRLLHDRVRLVEIPLTGELACKTRILAQGVPVLRLDDGDGRAAGATDEAREAVGAASAILVADYGRGTADVLREALARAARKVPVVWDPHPRGGPPVKGTRLVTPSAAEARAFAARTEEVTAGGGARCDGGPDRPRPELHHAAEDARRLIRSWGVNSVAVTLGPDGALLSHGDAPLLVPAPHCAPGDACGAGDRFAATAAGLLADGALPEKAVHGAVHAATRYVTDGGAAGLRHDQDPDPPTSETVPHPEPALLADRVRTRGGTVVAAGGCFDLLHAGHVALLQEARRIGDCLIVCVNSDASVRRRKGATRPLVPVADRVRVLRALSCVDAVAVFDEDTPERLLKELRPHIWAKGGDYALAQLPEAPLVGSWGGEVVLLPYLDGRSTTELAAKAALDPAERPAGRARAAER